MLACIAALVAATLSLQSGGSPAAESAEHLVEELRGPARDAALQSLVGLGRAAVPALVEALKRDDPAVVSGAIAALGRMGKTSEPAAPALAEFLRKDPSLAWPAARALCSIGPNAKAAIPAVNAIVADASQPVSRRAMAAIVPGFVGPEARACVPTFVDVLKTSPCTELHVVVLASLGGMGSAPAAALVKGCKETSMLRLYSGIGIGLIGPEATGGINALSNAFDVPDWAMQGVAIWSLGRLGSAAQGTLAQARKEQSKLEKKFSRGGVVDPLMMENTSEVLHLFKSLGVNVEAPDFEASLPPRLVDLDGNGVPCLGEVVEQLAGHLAACCGAAKDAIQALSDDDFAALEKKLRPTVGLAKGVEALAGTWAPPKKH
jgi:HEAT repeat protein